MWKLTIWYQRRLRVMREYAILHVVIRHNVIIFIKGDEIWKQIYLIKSHDYIKFRFKKYFYIEVQSNNYWSRSIKIWNRTSWNKELPLRKWIKGLWSYMLDSNIETDIYIYITYWQSKKVDRNIPRKC